MDQIGAKAAGLLMDVNWMLPPNMRHVLPLAAAHLLAAPGMAFGALAAAAGVGLVCAGRRGRKRAREEADAPTQLALVPVREASASHKRRRLQAPVLLLEDAESPLAEERVTECSSCDADADADASDSSGSSSSSSNSSSGADDSACDEEEQRSSADDEECADKEPADKGDALVERPERTPIKRKREDTGDQLVTPAPKKAETAAAAAAAASPDETDTDWSPPTRPRNATGPGNLLAKWRTVDVGAEREWCGASERGSESGSSCCREIDFEGDGSDDDEEDGNAQEERNIDSSNLPYVHSSSSSSSQSSLAYCAPHYGAVMAAALRQVRPADTA